MHVVDATDEFDVAFGSMRQRSSSLPLGERHGDLCKQLPMARHKTIDLVFFSSRMNRTALQATPFASLALDFSGDTASRNAQATTYFTSSTRPRLLGDGPASLFLCTHLTQLATGLVSGRIDFRRCQIQKRLEVVIPT